jgi:hypothetical protein
VPECSSVTPSADDVAASIAVTGLGVATVTDVDDGAIDHDRHGDIDTTPAAATDGGSPVTSYDVN